MQGSYKPFSPALYEQHNRAAIDAVRSYINSQGLYVMDNDDKYGPDLVVYVGFKPKYYAEAEVKLIWSGSEFPFDSLQIPERKQKFLKLGKPIEFYVCNREYTHAFIVPDYVLEKSELIEVANRLVASGEKFYRVNIGDCIYVTLK